MKYAFIREKQVAFPVTAMCRVLGVSTSGYYDWLKAPESTRSKEDAALATKISSAHERSRGRYGSPRVHAELRAKGIRVSRKRVARIMRTEGLAARRKRRFRRSIIPIEEALTRARTTGASSSAWAWSPA